MTKFDIGRVKKVKIKTKDTFVGFYRDHHISIEKEEDDNMGFYIQVTAPSGALTYDGYFGDMWSDIDDAIREAITGSMLA